MGTEPHDVVVMLYDGVQMLDVAGPIDAFASANALGAHYRITHASLTGDDVVASSGARHGAYTSIGDLPQRIGTLLVPGSPNWQASITDTALVTSPIDTPTGFVNFSVCGPLEFTNVGCPSGGTAVGSGVDLDASGSATSDSFTPSHAGVYCGSDHFARGERWAQQRRAANAVQLKAHILSNRS